jgi:hypothetical protein
MEACRSSWAVGSVVGQTSGGLNLEPCLDQDASATSVALGHTRVVQRDDEIIVGVRGPATLRLVEPPRTAAAAVRVDEFFTARAPPVGGHAVLSSIRPKVCQRPVMYWPVGEDTVRDVINARRYVNGRGR